MSATFDEVNVAPTHVHSVHTASHEEALTSESLDERARKRLEIGLSRDRPTARRDLQRPPERGQRQRLSGERPPIWMWVLTLLMGAMLSATVLLIAARLLNAPTAWTHVAEDLRAWRASPSRTFERPSLPSLPSLPFAFNPPKLVPTLSLRSQATTSPLSSDFSYGTYALGSVEVQGRRAMATLADEGLFRIRVWPQNLAWVTLGAGCLAPYQLEAEAAVAELTPHSYAGLLGRFQPNEDFYLFAVDGRGRYRVLLVEGGETTLIQRRRVSEAINPAGAFNRLELSDDGRALTFSANGSELAVVEEPALPVGKTGFAGGTGTTAGEIDFDSYNFQVHACKLP